MDIIQISIFVVKYKTHEIPRFTQKETAEGLVRP